MGTIKITLHMSMDINCLSRKFYNNLILPIFFQYTKYIMTKEMEVKAVEFTVEGRKEPLKQIRENMFKKHKHAEQP